MNKNFHIFCLTHAGGTADFFNILETELNDVELVKLEYAGHGNRIKEDFYPDFSALADDMYNRIKEYLTTPYALLGYSMGSISVVEVLRKIIENEEQLPQHIFLAAHTPYTKKYDISKSDEDTWVKERTISFGDIPQKLINNKIFWRTYLPIYKADYSIIRKYEFEKLNLSVDIPTTVFYSENDTPYKDMLQWSKYFVGNTEYEQYNGNHFFIRDHYKEIADTIKSKIGDQL